MRLDKAGEPTTIAELLARFAERPWLYEVEDLHEKEKLAATAAGTVRLYPRGLTAREPIETGDGHYVVVVDGDLATSDHVQLRTDDYVQARVLVTGDLCARSLSYDNGARIVVEGAAHIERACIGQHGDRNGVLDVYGELVVPLLLLDSYSSAAARGGVRALIYSAGAFWEDLRPDIVDVREGEDGRYFRPEYLDQYGDLDLDKAVTAVRAGAALLLPGVEESHSDRLRLRRGAI